MIIKFTFLNVSSLISRRKYKLLHMKRKNMTHSQGKQSIIINQKMAQMLKQITTSFKSTNNKTEVSWFMHIWLGCSAFYGGTKTYIQNNCFFLSIVFWIYLYYKLVLDYYYMRYSTLNSNIRFHVRWVCLTIRQAKLW